MRFGLPWESSICGTIPEGAISLLSHALLALRRAVSISGGPSNLAGGHFKSAKCRSSNGWVTASIFGIAPSARLVVLDAPLGVRKANQLQVRNVVRQPAVIWCGAAMCGHRDLIGARREPHNPATFPRRMLAETKSFRA